MTDRLFIFSLGIAVFDKRFKSFVGQTESLLLLFFFGGGGQEGCKINHNIFFIIFF